MRQSIIRVLDSRRAVPAAMAVTWALGYFFIFVWAPHPWSWQGIDSYHELAKSLARGESFQTTDVPWGYAYYAAFLYRTFGERVWLPLVIQAALNGLVPWLLYRLIAPLAGRRIAVLSALIVGVFSFNTVYASTQSSDAICTVLFLLGLLCFARGIREERLWLFAVSGILFGLVPQFRPNLVLLPAVMAVAPLLKRPRTLQAVGRVGVFIALVAALQLPWVVRNYRLTGLFLPTSTHGGVQLWYGTLQVGDTLESRAHNPRFYFASPAFTYTSMWHRPLVIGASNSQCTPDVMLPARMTYWTDRDGTRHDVLPEPGWGPGVPASYAIPALPNHTALYYYFELPTSGGKPIESPIGGATNPYVAFISDDHLGDLDQHDDVLDMFDIVRALRHIAWAEPMRAASKVDVNHDGAVTEADVNAIATLQLGRLAERFPAPAARVESNDQSVTMKMADGSWLRVPRDFGGRQTDVQLSLDGEMAPALLSRTRTFTSLSVPPPPPGSCFSIGEPEFNNRFYLSEPHGMQRYMALAMDNINRDPMAFVRASLYRAVRLFIVRGTEDLSTSQQFRGSSLVYMAGTVLSLAYFAVFCSGVIIAYRRRLPLVWLAVPVIYVPATICFVLTNMRYTVTVQPLMFAFVAAAIAAALRLDEPTDGKYSRSTSP